MSNDKPGQRKPKSGGRAQGSEIEEDVSARVDDDDQDEISAGAQAGTEDEEEQNGRAQQSAARRAGPQSAPGHEREGFDARGGRNARAQRP